MTHFSGVEEAEHPWRRPEEIRCSLVAEMSGCLGFGLESVTTRSKVHCATHSLRWTPGHDQKLVDPG